MVEADVIVPPPGRTMSGEQPRAAPGAERSSNSNSYLVTPLPTAGSSDQSGDSRTRRSKFVRVVISNKFNGAVKLETRFPALMVGAIAEMIPQVGYHTVASRVLL